MYKTIVKSTMDLFCNYYHIINLKPKIEFIINNSTFTSFYFRTFNYLNLVSYPFIHQIFYTEFITHTRFRNKCKSTTFLKLYLNFRMKSSTKIFIKKKTHLYFKTNYYLLNVPNTYLLKIINNMYTKTKISNIVIGRQQILNDKSGL